ncbi:MAG: glycoside hydrolase family 2 protein [Actinomycetota bacterium]|nr:glycoside hydrolase family 2 protein [Actinomycetota bacterium]
MIDLVEGWKVAPSPPGECASPTDVNALHWRPAQVPGTAAGAVGADGRDFDAEDWWFRCAFTVPAAFSGHDLALELDGIATVSEVFLDGELIHASSSMWESHVVALDRAAGAPGEHELTIACRALKPLMGVRRRPAARWRTRVVNAGNLRWYRTMVFGRSPGFAPGPAPVGPWRPVRIVSRSKPGLESLTVRSRLDGDAGVVSVAARVRGRPENAEVLLAGDRYAVPIGDRGALEAELRVPDAARWWPHTHGPPALHDLSIKLDGECVAERRVGFRSLGWAPDILEDGLDLHVNGAPIFVRGAVWTPSDLVSLAPDQEQLRRLLELVRDAGMNMLRVVGTGAYESPTFHDLCDELGILVWQDLMFANLDYPTADPEFREQVASEARQVLSALAGRPSLAVVCGNSEVEQQPAMMGLDPALGRGELWEAALPQIVAESGADCAYVRSTPCGGDLPFHSDHGITHYFGVSGYFMPPPDARRAAVRFAAECLAFANVPDEVEVPVHHPDWKAGVARDAGTGWDLGAGWDFDDVRDYYLSLLYRVDPVQLRRSDHERYLDLSRAASGEVMAELMGEWRRQGSPCAGALVLWLKDMLPGAGLGVIDHKSMPKVAYYYLKRALSPVAVWMTDEGVNGIMVHVANDRPEPLRARLHIALYRDLESRVAAASEDLELGARSGTQRTIEGLLGRFVDAAWAYRFGPPSQAAIVTTLQRGGSSSMVISRSVRFPAGLPTAREPLDRLGLEADTELGQDGATSVRVRSRALAYGVRVRAPGYVPEDDCFTLEPDGEHVVEMRPATPQARFSGATLTALNLDGAVNIAAVRQ